MVGPHSGAAPAAPPKPVATPMQPKMVPSSDINRKMKSLVLDTGNHEYTAADAKDLANKLRGAGIPAVVTVGTQDKVTGVVTPKTSLTENKAQDLANAYDRLLVKVSQVEVITYNMDDRTAKAFTKTAEKINAMEAENQELKDRLSKMEREMLAFQQRMMENLTSFKGDLHSMRNSSRTLAVETTRLRQMMVDDTHDEGYNEACKTPPTSPSCKRRLHDYFPPSPRLGPQHEGKDAAEDIGQNPLSLNFCTSMA